MNYDHIPATLKDSARFCVWSYRVRAGKPTKVPYNPCTGAKARSNDPGTFSTFDDATAALSRHPSEYSGLGIGMSISQGGSTGGTDIVALIITKFRNISPGRIILTMDVFIIASSLLFPSFDVDGQRIPFDSKFSIAVYGMIIVTVCGHVVDLYLAGSKQSVQLFILSRHYEEIADMVSKDFHRGVTVLNGEGWYTKQPASVLMVITRKTDLNLLLRSIKRVDPDAFLSISSVSGVYGQGFDSIKGAKKS